MMIARRAVKLSCERKTYAIEIDGGAAFLRAPYHASGAAYRTLLFANWSV